MLCSLILPLQLFLRNQLGESSKQEIQAPWSTPIHHVKWWISRFRGVYRTITASYGRSFWFYLKAFGHFVISQEVRFGCCGVLYMLLHFIIFVIFIIIIIIIIVIIIIIIIIIIVVNIIFIIFIIIRIFIKSSLLFLWSKLTVRFCFFYFHHLS